MDQIFSLKLFIAILAIVKEIASQSSCVSIPASPPRCGKAMESTQDHISYSPYEFIGDNERCVWIIAAPSNDSTFEFQVLYTGFPSGENGTDSGAFLTISGIPIVNSTHHIVSGPGDINITRSTTVVIVFSSGPNARSSNLTGFILEYKVPTTTQQSHFVSIPPAHLRFNSTNANTDTSVVVVPPIHNYFPGRKYELIYLETITQASQDCIFRQEVYHYNRNNITSPWSIQQSFCNGIVSRSIAGHDDIMIITSTWIYGPNRAARDQWYFHLKC